ncbi:MAG: alpha/beta hydrolase-fold protein [Arenimonas sp.]
MLRRLGGLALLLLAGLTAAPMAEASDTGFLDRHVKLAGVDYRYQVYVPEGPRPAAGWPVLLFLHGSGERGDDGLRQTQVGLPAAIRADRARFPMLVVMPQARADTRWSGAIAKMAIAALDASLREFHGDPERQLLSGLSIGGQGVWLLAAENPQRFAAIAPVSSFLFLRLDDDVANAAVAAALLLEFPEFARDDPAPAFVARLPRLPVWMFHGGADDLVPPLHAQQLRDALRARGDAPKYTEYAGGNHNAWDAAYSDPGLVPWLLAQRRRR